MAMMYCVNSVEVSWNSMYYFFSKVLDMLCLNATAPQATTQKSCDQKLVLLQANNHF